MIGVMWRRLVERVQKVNMMIIQVQLVVIVVVIVAVVLVDFFGDFLHKRTIVQRGQRLAMLISIHVDAGEMMMMAVGKLNVIAGRTSHAVDHGRVHGVKYGTAAPGHVIVEEKTGRSFRRLIGQLIAHAEHELYGVAKSLAEKTKQRKVNGQVNAGEKVGERIEYEKVPIEHELFVVGDENVRQRERHLTY